MMYIHWYVIRSDHDRLNNDANWYTIRTDCESPPSRASKRSLAILPHKPDRRLTLSLSTIRTLRTLVNHYTVCNDTDSHIRVCICMHADRIYTDCMYTNRTDANCITVDCNNANHVDTCNCDTIFCNTLDCAYKYAQVMLSLDFDNVKSNKSSQSCEYRTSLSADGIPDKLLTRTCNRPIDSKFPLKKNQRILI